MQAIMATGNTTLEKPITTGQSNAYAKSEYWDINKLKLWDKNPRSIKDNRFAELKTRLQRLGQTKPLRITRDGTVIGGNMRLRAMRELGIVEVWVSISEAITDKEIFDEALTDNEEFGYYEKEQLAELALALELTPLELQSYELNLGKTTTLDLVLDEFGPEVEEDEVPEVDEVNEPESVLGEVYQLGSHRLMCGSATEQGDVELLMDGAKADMVFTDPPYGMNLDATYSSMAKNNSSLIKRKNKNPSNHSQVIGDDEEYDPTHLLDLAPEIITWGADYYADKLPKGGSWFVWDKRLDDSADKMFGSSFELAWSKKPHKRDVARIKSGLFGARDEYGSVKRVHPTQKPLELCQWFTNKFSDSGNIVLDLFGGSGSTLIACEQTNRTCYMMELDPKYCDVIRKRYAKHTGEEESWQEATPPAHQLQTA